MLRLKFGKNERDFPIKLVSDAKAVEEDIAQYVSATKAVRESVLTKREANKIRRLQDDLVGNYVYTTHDIEKTLTERNKKGTSAANLGSEQTRVAMVVNAATDRLKEAKLQLAIAEKADDAAEISKATIDVENTEKELQGYLEEEGVVLDKVKSRKQLLASRSVDQKWAKINKRALATNQLADANAFKEKDLDDGESAFNPYARRKAKPKILWEVGQNDGKGEGEESKEGEAKTDNTANGAKDSTTNGDATSTPSLIQEQQEKAAALSQSHQFAIDEEVMAQSSSYTRGISGLNDNKDVPKRVRKGLSLAEYQERKAAETL
jgi:RNA polymerase-associated protein RTF1